MAYLHEQIINNNLIKRWANDVPDLDTTNPDYETPKYQILKIGTQEHYVDAVDLLNSERIALGLEPYYYEVTDIVIENDDGQETIEE